MQIEFLGPVYQTNQSAVHITSDNESYIEYEMDSRYNLGARNLDWLVEIFY